MIKCSQIAIAVLFVVGLSGPAGAAVFNGQNWADSVYEYTTNIQNSGLGVPAELMSADPSNQSWVTGVSDADVDGNGYAWDAGDNDYVAGWRANAPGEYVIVNFVIGLEDLAGDDLVIHVYGGPSASANVLASTDGNSYTQIGTIGSGTSGQFRDETFDFAGLLGDDVHYVKVLRAANGAQTGIFFDSFASVPEPATMVLLICGGAGLFLRRRAQKPALERSESAGK